MGVSKEAYMHDVEAANDAASVVSEDIAATNGPSRLPAFEQAIVIPAELPEMPAEIVEGVLLETHKMLLTGPSKANKTWGLINLAVSVATGGWWIDFKCAQRKVLYIDLETDHRTLQKRISTVSIAKSADAKVVRENLTVWPLRGKSCGLEEITAELFCRCKAGDFGMVIIDPAYMEALLSTVTPETFAIIAAVTFAGGIIGSLVGRAVFKKHLERAGIA